MISEKISKLLQSPNIEDNIIGLKAICASKGKDWMLNNMIESNSKEFRTSDVNLKIFKLDNICVLRGAMFYEAHDTIKCDWRHIKVIEI